MYYATINGTKHKVTRDEQGNEVYDPPLPKDQKAKFDNRMKDLLKHGKCPSLQTDTAFHAGRGTLLEQMEGDEAWVKKLTQEARKKGYNPGANDVYVGQLARDGAGDPNAWFKPSEGRAEIEARARKMGVGIEGAGISVEAKPFEEKEAPRLNPKLRRSLENYYRKSGEAGNMTDKELSDHVIKTHGRQD